MRIFYSPYFGWYQVRIFDTENERLLSICKEHGRTYGPKICSMVNPSIIVDAEINEDEVIREEELKMVSKKEYNEVVAKYNEVVRHGKRMAKMLEGLMERYKGKMIAEFGDEDQVSKVLKGFIERCNEISGEVIEEQMIWDRNSFLYVCPDCREIYAKLGNPLKVIGLTEDLGLCACRVYYSNFKEPDGVVWSRILTVWPEFAKYCYWEKLDGLDWAHLLSQEPQFAEHCDWEKLDGWDWSLLLSDQPRFAVHCDWEKLSGTNWADLLSVQPQFSDRCNWNNLEGRNWRYLLCFQLQFADKCDWKKLDGNDWSNLLQGHPQFAEHCDWNRLDGWDWAYLLYTQPRFAEYCDWVKLDSWNWSYLLDNQPQFKEYKTV